MIAPLNIIAYAQPACLEIQTVQYSEQISKNGKSFHYTEQFFDFLENFSVGVRSVGLVPEMSSEAIESIHLKFESRDD